jgi:hypothetical protein
VSRRPPSTSTSGSRAAPPVGDLRWQPPQPLERWQGPREATQFGNHCAQEPSPFGTESASEDCLYLNVFTPNGKVAQEKNGKTKLKKAMVRRIYSLLDQGDEAVWDLAPPEFVLDFSRRENAPVRVRAG